ncbi:uncharacterized protein EV420DRAFT_1566771 [Desarmillaria tabescens]|uniref:Uncharacterized protein n=1 Tax=Armillaria tabescens TaxID=1929756 RepID=A0AA39MVC4_ARMTA|nr:uncharacterized protein EV420DRAFT_1566771 [Desarmillaria tabescens]KAK0448441.1 hypothetical protein EV420DRAFT_1566771 [Desarmillaria tabescens]
MSINSINLPQEIIDSIVDTLYNDRIALLSLNGTSRGFSHRACSYLFRTVSLRSDLLPKFVELWSHSPRILPYIQNLHVSDYTHEMDESLRLLPNIHSISVIDGFATFVAVIFPAITSLTLRNVTFSSHLQFDGFLRKLPKLKHLSLTDISLPRYCSPPPIVEKYDFVLESLEIRCRASMNVLRVTAERDMCPLPSSHDLDKLTVSISLVDFLPLILKRLSENGGRVNSLHIGPSIAKDFQTGPADWSFVPCHDSLSQLQHISLTVIDIPGMNPIPALHWLINFLSHAPVPHSLSSLTITIAFSKTSNGFYLVYNQGSIWNDVAAALPALSRWDIRLTNWDAMKDLEFNTLSPASEAMKQHIEKRLKSSDSSGITKVWVDYFPDGYEQFTGGKFIQASRTSSIFASVLNRNIIPFRFI